MATILGLSFDYHDAAAALIIDGQVVAAAQEERFSRIKHDKRLPTNAVSFCLAQAGLSPGGIDQVVFYERPLAKLDRIRRMVGTDGTKRFERIVANWLVDGRLDVPGRIVAATSCDQAKVVDMDHHLAHAASAFYCSPFERAAVITIDGVGEDDTATISLGHGAVIDPLLSVRFPHSLGLLYSGFTAYLGFEVNEGEYKVMGMAAFGTPVHADRMMCAVRLQEDGGFILDQDWFDFTRADAKPYQPSLESWLGPPRQPSTGFCEDGHLSEQDSCYADIAASIQAVAERTILHMVSTAMKRTGCRDVCLAGGVALNSVANGRIQRELGCRLYVHPAAGDAGGALGAALHFHHAVLGQPRGLALVSPYLGRGWSDDELAVGLRTQGLEFTTLPDDDTLVAFIAARLAEGAVVGWFQGRAEWGPRALGNRSILASPCSAEMQRNVNEKIKFREPFRPFAPSVPSERAGEFFDFTPVYGPTAPEHMMLTVHPVREQAKARIPAVTHVDGSARLHLVEREINPLYHALLTAFGERSGVPVLLNTSFNLRGEPIVDSPADAVATFRYSGLDFLVMGHHVAAKEQL